MISPLGMTGCSGSGSSYGDRPDLPDERTSTSRPETPSSSSLTARLQVRQLVSPPPFEEVHFDYAHPHLRSFGPYWR